MSIHVILSKAQRNGEIIENIQSGVNNCNQHVETSDMKEKLINREYGLGFISDPDMISILNEIKDIWEEHFRISCCRKIEDSRRVEFDRISPSYFRIHDGIHHRDNSLLITRNIGMIYGGGCRQNNRSIPISRTENIAKPEN